MKYIELTIKTERNNIEIVQAALLEHGYDSMRIDDPLDALDIAEHQKLYKYDYINEEIAQKAGKAASEDDVTITLYFTDDEKGRRQLSEAETLVCDLISYRDAAVSYNIAVTGDDSEWLYKWQEHFKPVKIGERIVVKPGWEDYEPADGELVIEMDPGMAFGSGLHETTSMCIKALEKDLGGSYDPSRYPVKVLDVGTGTGILAMAAVLLGADEALGIDIDDEAVRVSNENIYRNGLEGRISIMHGNLMDGIDYDPDIIVANLMADLVIMLSPAAAAQLRPGGTYITSGILDIKEDTVAEAVRAAGFTIKEIMADGEWRAITAVKD